jgi:hypothetical protein
MTFRRPEFDRDVLALDEARFLQALAKRGDEVRHVSERRAAEKSDHRHCSFFGRLLRTRGIRPCGRTANQRDELAPPHSITSSASASTRSGIWRPSALAALRLMMNSNLLACMIGRSAAFSPLTIRPA